MKCVITYFSQSGNTKKMAYAVREGMKKVTGQCDIIPMTVLDVRDLVGYDVIGVGSPCWSGVPLYASLNLRDVIGHQEADGI